MRTSPHAGPAIGYGLEGTGDPIVTLHPVGMDRHFWAPFARELKGRYALVGIDLPGHGESDTPDMPPELTGMALSVGDALEGMLAGRPAIVIGCSMGGMVAQELALARPDLVRSLVLANTAHTLPETGREAMRQRARLAREGMDRVVETTLDRWFGAQFRKRNPQVVDAFRRHLLGIDPLVHAWCWDAISRLDTASRLPSLTMPTLVVTGEIDGSAPPAVAQAIAGCITGSEYRIAPGAAHMFPVEQPGLLARWVAEFTRRV